MELWYEWECFVLTYSAIYDILVVDWKQPCLEIHVFSFILPFPVGPELGSSRFYYLAVWSLVSQPIYWWLKSRDRFHAFPIIIFVFGLGEYSKNEHFFVNQLDPVLFPTLTPPSGPLGPIWLLWPPLVRLVPSKSFLSSAPLWRLWRRGETHRFPTLFQPDLTKSQQLLQP